MPVLIFVLVCMLLPESAIAAETDVSQGLTRMVLGMLVVLLFIGLLAFLARKVFPGHNGVNHGVIRQIGGLSLSPRERVVVLEINKRWLVVGLNGSQMTALADLPADATDAQTLGSEHLDAPIQATSTIDMQASFASRLQQAMQHTLRQSVKSFNSKP